MDKCSICGKERIVTRFRDGVVGMNARLQDIIYLLIGVEYLCPECYEKDEKINGHRLDRAGLLMSKGDLRATVKMVETAWDKKLNEPT